MILHDLFYTSYKPINTCIVHISYKQYSEKCISLLNVPGFNDEGRTVLGTINGIAYICCSFPMAYNLLLEVLAFGMFVTVDKQNILHAHTKI